MKILMCFFVMLGVLSCTSVKNKYEYRKNYSCKKQIVLLKELAKSYGVGIDYPVDENDIPFSEKDYNHILGVIHSMGKMNGLKGKFHYEPDSGFTIPLGTDIVKSMVDSVGLSVDTINYKVDSTKLCSDSIMK